MSVPLPPSNHMPSSQADHKSETRNSNTRSIRQVKFTLSPSSINRRNVVADVGTHASHSGLPQLRACTCMPVPPCWAPDQAHHKRRRRRTLVTSVSRTQCELHAFDFTLNRERRPRLVIQIYTSRLSWNAGFLLSQTSTSPRSIVQLGVFQ
jgi:hypothetical protein